MIIQKKWYLFTLTFGIMLFVFGTIIPATLYAFNFIGEKSILGAVATISFFVSMIFIAIATSIKDKLGGFSFEFGSVEFDNKLLKNAERRKRYSLILTSLCMFFGVLVIASAVFIIALEIPRGSKLMAFFVVIALFSLCGFLYCLINIAGIKLIK